MLKGTHHSFKTRKKLSLISSGKIHSEETKKKMSIARTGLKLSQSSKLKIGLANSGREPWNKGKKLYPRTLETRMKLSVKHKGRKLSREHKDKISLSLRGENCRFWKGGITSLRHQIRDSFQYRQWRSDVFTRDNFTCKWCGQVGGEIQADHIIPFSVLLQKWEITTLEQALACEELWNINNGRTLCKPCHKKTDSYMSKSCKPFQLELVI